jgi:hypothetical protein
VLVALLVGTTFIATAEDYVIPTGVTVLTEEQLLKQIIGNTVMDGIESWVEYFEPPTGDQKKGSFRTVTGLDDWRAGSLFESF